MSLSSMMWVGYGGALLFVVGTVVAASLTLSNAESYPRRVFADYLGALDGQVRFLLLKTTGLTIAKKQLGGIVAVSIVAYFIDEPIFFLLIPPILLAPYYVLQQRSAERVRRIETQLDPWLLMLSNALKASPSLGEAMNSSAKLMRAPIAEELDLVLKEMTLGTPLDQAILNMSIRIDAQSVSSALATILVGRQTGGDLPQILEESSATLREMARLEGVVRAKTAEGKAQAYVLGAIPFVLIGAIHMVDEHWLAPLADSSMGFGIMGVAALLWVTAIIMSRKILAVDV